MILALLTAGCAGSGQVTGQPGASQPPAENQPAKNQAAAPLPGGDAAGNPAVSESLTFIFTDATGREVELPRNIERVSPSGTMAQVVLFTLVPDKLVGLSVALTDAEKNYMDDRIKGLPVLGNFSADTLNLESVMLTAPQVIVDIGQVSPSSADDMQSIQDKTGIPAVFVELDDIGSMLTGYAALGELFGVEEEAQKIIDYISENIISVINRAEEIPEADRVSVYYGINDGLTSIIANSFHSDAIDFAGGRNVAAIAQTIRGGAAEISMEQLILWNPDVIIFAHESIYDTVASLPEWGALSAITENRYYEIPHGPYNWVNRPPSVNRLLGVRWLANLLYPEIFPFDMAQEAREFYKLFYHFDLTDAQIEGLLSKATAK